MLGIAGWWPVDGWWEGVECLGRMPAFYTSLLDKMIGVILEGVAKRTSITIFQLCLQVSLQSSSHNLTSVSVHLFFRPSVYWSVTSGSTN